MTTFSLDAFRTAVGDGGARPNQFQVTIGFPSGAPNILASLQSSFLVRAASLPGQTMSPATIFYRGRQVHFAGDRLFNPWGVTIINDSNFLVRNALEQWTRAIEDEADKFGYTQPYLYQADMDIQQLDKNGNVLKEYRITGAFPTDISEVPLDYQANDTISETQCTFIYQYFTRVNDFGAAERIVPPAVGIGGAIG
jgi:hypothetical protein